MNRSILKSTALVALCLASTCAAPLRGQTEENLLVNPGLEEWDPGSLAPGRSTTTTELPVQWRAGRYASEAAVDPAFEQKGEVFKDTEIKHGGEASARIENGLTTDTIDLVQLIPVEPNVTYKITFWVRGEDIVLNSGDGAGATSCAAWGPVEDFTSNFVVTWKQFDVREGSFDWQPIEYTVDTGDAAEQLSVGLQLRRSSGKVWYDDLEVTRVGEAGSN